MRRNAMIEAGQCRPLAVCARGRVLDTTLNECVRTECNLYMMHRNAMSGECEIAPGSVAGIIIVLFLGLVVDFVARRGLVLSLEEAAFGEQEGKRWKWPPLAAALQCGASIGQSVPCLRRYCCRCCCCCGSRCNPHGSNEEEVAMEAQQAAAAAHEWRWG